MKALHDRNGSLSDEIHARGRGFCPLCFLPEGVAESILDVWIESRTKRHVVVREYPRP